MKKELLLSIILLIHFAFLPAQKTLIPLWENGVSTCQNEHQMEVKIDDRIGRVISKVSEPTLEVFLPPESQSNGTAVIICPGGGYTILAYDWEGTSVAKWLNTLGVTAFVLRYRLPHWENDACRDQVALDDAQRAIRMVRSQAKTWKIDPEKIGVMGFSAGGHLASTAGTHFDSGNPQANEYD
jgi:acetyl esterase/lipase